ncbi:MAG: hypothetical protein IJ024_08085 [Lachnospiraceae bacterium]|nr:hypothetical protein [Lachnospiraceae bacterium]
MSNFSINNDSLKKFSALLVYIGIALLAISDSGIQLLILHVIGPGSRTLRLIAMWLLFAKVILTRYTKKEFLILTPITILALYNYTVSGNIYCVYTILVIACLKDIDFSTLFKVLFYSTLSAVVFVGILSFFEIGSPTQLTQDFGRGVVETRYCFGLYHPNIWHQAIARCIVFACIGYYKQLNIVHLLILFAFNYFIYTLSVSRTGLLAIWIFLILVIFYKYLNKLMHTLFVKICAFLGILSVYGLYVYFTWDFAVNWSLNSQLFDWKITTGRIQQALEFLSYSPIQMFSSRFPDNGTLFDLGAFRIFYECGYLWAGLFFLAFFVLIILALKNNWDIIIPTAVYFIFCSLYEFDPVTRPSYNVIVFFLALLIYSTLDKNIFMPSSRRKGNPEP